ncbi:MAG: hypothetical protein LC104_14570 [Bacteroidales bacterium]|nr:hypothetical protein [Bacteroidales bacterium]
MWGGSTLIGCRNLGKPDAKFDLLTAELRTRDQELAAARSEITHLRLLNETYQRQLGHIPSPIPGTGTGMGGVLVPGQPGCPPGDPAYRPASTPALPVTTITLAAGTGGFDDDGCPGDESLQLVIVPKDSDGSPVKAPGRVAVACYEITPEGLKVPIGRWEVSPDELRKVWRAGFISSGYFVLLQWDRLPNMKKIRVVVRFVTLDGREFEADRDANVVPISRPTSPVLPPAPGSTQPIPPPASPLPTVPPPTVPELPLPSGVETPAAKLGTVRIR